MRIKDFSVNNCRRRRQQWRMRSVQSFVFDLPIQAVEVCLRAAEEENQNVLRMNQRTRHIQVTAFNLNSISDHQCLRDYRFKSRDIVRISHMINFQGPTIRNRYISDPIIATCLFLHRCATPLRWHDVETIYGLQASQSSEIFWEVCESFVEQFSYTLELRAGFLIERAPAYAEAIRQQGSPLDSVIGIIDCTKIRMCGPGGRNDNQRACYNGHKKYHCLVYQTISTPDGLMFSLYGPLVGGRHDLTVYHESGYDQILEGALIINGRQYYIFGDSAYLMRPWMQRPFIMAQEGTNEREFNREMSRIRILVEHNYRDLKQFWTHNDFARNMKIRKAPISLI